MLVDCSFALEFGSTDCQKVSANTRGLRRIYGSVTYHRNVLIITLLFRSRGAETASAWFWRCGISVLPAAYPGYAEPEFEDLCMNRLHGVISCGYIDQLTYRCIRNYCSEESKVPVFQLLKELKVNQYD